MPERLDLNHNSPKEVQKYGTFTDIVLPNGEIRVIYIDHQRPIDTSLIPKKTDGIFIEWPNPPESLSDLSNLEMNHKQIHELHALAQNENIPLLFHDVRGKPIMFSEYKLLEFLNYINIVSPLMVSRLTNLSIVEASALTFPLIYSSLEQIISRAILNSSSNLDLLTKEKKVATRVIPYKKPYVIRLRNALWATKLNWALNNGLGTHLTTIVGVGHVGVEDYLRREAEGKGSKILRATSRMWPFFAENDSYYTIRRFSQSRPKGVYDDVREYEVPKLKAIALNS